MAPLECLTIESRAEKRLASKKETADYGMTFMEILMDRSTQYHFGEKWIFRAKIALGKNGLEYLWMKFSV